MSGEYQATGIVESLSQVVRYGGRGAPAPEEDMDRRADNPFNIAAAPEPAGGLGQPVVETDISVDPKTRVKMMVASSPMFVFIKGTPQRPMCGFSANTVAVMDSLDVPYRTFDVLSDESIRSAAKEFAGWPTFPQVYVRGEFIGGNDIVTEMHGSGELQAMVAGDGS
jgi:monothiol glutaredoxin